MNCEIRTRTSHSPSSLLLARIHKVTRHYPARSPQASGSWRKDALPCSLWPIESPTHMAAKKARGRQPDASSKSGKIRELLKTGMAPMDIAKRVGCTPALVYNVKARIAGGPKKRGPGRPPKAKSGGATRVDGLDGLLAAVRSVEKERNEMRAALEKLQAVLSAALQ